MTPDQILAAITPEARNEPDSGIVKIRSELFNASGTRLMMLVTNALFQRRTPSAAQGAGR